VIDPGDPVAANPEGPPAAPNVPRAGARRRRAVRNSLANGMSRLVSIATSFVVTPLVIAATGSTAYGIWVLIGSVVAYASLLDLGIGGAVTKYVAEHRATGDDAAVRATVRTAQRLYLALGTTVGLLGVAASAVVPTLLRIPPDATELAARTTVLMGIGLGVAIACTTGIATLRGLQRHDLVAAISIVSSLLSLAGTVVALAAGWSVLGIVAIGIPIPVLGQALALIAIRRVAPELRSGEPAAAGDWRRIVAFSWPLFLLDVAGRLQSKSDEIVVSVAVSLGSVAPYSLGRKLASIPRLIAEQFASVLLPIASELHALQDRARLQRLYLSGVRVSLAIAVPPTVALGLLAVPVLRAWVGPGFESAAPVLVLLAIASLVDLSLWPAGFVLQGIARHRALGPISLATGAANLVLSLVLAGPFGIVGVAVGTLLPAIVEAGLLLTPYTLRVLGIGPRRFVADAVAPAVLPAVPMAAAILLSREVIAPDSLAALAAIVAIGAAAYGVTYLIPAATAPERATIREAIGAIRAGLRATGRRARTR
jgi:O-antigen/teichoic acid export membrane protein